MSSSRSQAPRQWHRVQHEGRPLPFSHYYADPAETPTLRPREAVSSEAGTLRLLGEDALVVVGPQPNPHLG
jgi:hypothetical protein